MQWRQAAHKALWNVALTVAMVSIVVLVLWWFDWATVSVRELQVMFGLAVALDVLFELGRVWIEVGPIANKPAVSAFWSAGLWLLLAVLSMLFSNKPGALLFFLSALGWGSRGWNRWHSPLL